MWETIISIFSITAISSVFARTAPIIFASIGETISERVGVINLLQIVLRPMLKRDCQRAVPIFKKWPVEKAPVRHQSPSNTGFSLATKALKARSKSAVCIQIA